MIFESQLKRQRVLALVVIGLVDVAVAAIAARIMQQGVLVGVVLFVGLQVLSVIYVVVRSIADWLLFALGGRKLLVNKYLDLFRKFGFPTPQDVERSPEGYLAQVIENEACPIRTRINAAMLLGGFTTMTSLSGMQATMRHFMAFEEAAAKFQRDGPRESGLATEG